MREAFFHKLQELLNTEQKFSKNLDVLMANYKAYQAHLPETIFKYFQHVIENYYNPLPRNIFHNLVCNKNATNDDIVALLNEINHLIKTNLMPNLKYLASASLPKSYHSIAKAVKKASTLSTLLPVIENGLAAPFQAITRYNLLMKDMCQLCKECPSEIKEAMEKCYGLTAKLASEMNDLVKKIEQNLDTYSMLPENELDLTKIADRLIMEQKASNSAQKLFKLLNNGETSQRKQRAEKWLQTHFLKYVCPREPKNQKQNAIYFEAFIKEIANNFSRIQMEHLNNLISNLNLKIPHSEVSEAILQVGEKLGLEFSTEINYNTHLLKSLTRLFNDLTNQNQDNTKPFTILDELAELADLSQQLIDKEDLKVKKVAELKRLQTDCYLNSILNHPDSRSYRVLLHPFPDSLTSDDILLEAHIQAQSFEHEIRQLDKEIESLKSKIEPLKVKRENLIRRHNEIDYKNTYPLYYAVGKHMGYPNFFKHETQLMSRTADEFKSTIKLAHSKV